MNLDGNFIHRYKSFYNKNMIDKMIYKSCTYSSIVFIILGILLKNKNIFLRICLLILGVSSTIFHMLDHEIDIENDIHKYMENIYMFDVFMITITASFIVTESILLSIILGILSLNNINIKNGIYLLGFFNLISKLIKEEIFFIYFMIIIYAAISYGDNKKRYKKPPYHISWKPKNAFIWHTCNFLLLYKGLSK